MNVHKGERDADMTDWESMDKYDKRGEYRMKHEKNKTQELTQPT